MWIVDGQFCFHFLYDHYMVMTMKMIMMMMVGAQDDDDDDVGIIMLTSFWLARQLPTV